MAENENETAAPSSAVKQLLTQWSNTMTSDPVVSLRDLICVVKPSTEEMARYICSADEGFFEKLHALFITGFQSLNYLGFENDENRASAARDYFFHLGDQMIHLSKRPVVNYSAAKTAPAPEPAKAEPEKTPIPTSITFGELLKQAELDAGDGFYSTFDYVFGIDFLNATFRLLDAIRIVEDLERFGKPTWEKVNGFTALQQAVDRLKAVKIEIRSQSPVNIPIQPSEPQKKHGLDSITVWQWVSKQSRYREQWCEESVFMNGDLWRKTGKSKVVDV